ncbi:unnamed protein product, partial [marine sediment metagenome]
AILHPKTRIAYRYCPQCRVRFPASARECPKCGDKVSSSPENRLESPIPWYASVIIIIIGVICWVLGAGLEIAGLDEAGRFLVYAPLGNLLGLSLRP